MLPPGDWHCPNCTCKFCGVASETVKNGSVAANALLTCNLCERKCTTLSCIKLKFFQFSHM